MFAQIDRLKARFRADMKRLPALVEARLGAKRKVRVEGVWWCVRWQRRTYRGLTPAALLKALPKHGVVKPAEKPPELPFGGLDEHV